MKVPPGIPEYSSNWLNHLSGNWRPARLGITDITGEGVTQTVTPLLAAFYDSDGVYGFAYNVGSHIIVIVSTEKMIRDAAAESYANDVADETS